MSLCPHGVNIQHRNCDRCEEVAHAENEMGVRALRERAASKTKLNWMETRTQEVSQYYCTKCEEIFQFASDKHGTERPPVHCPMCGRPDRESELRRKLERRV